MLAHGDSSADDDGSADDSTAEVADAGDSGNGQGGPFIPYDRGKADIAAISPSAGLPPFLVSCWPGSTKKVIRSGRRS